MPNRVMIRTGLVHRTRSRQVVHRKRLINGRGYRRRCVSTFAAMVEGVREPALAMGLIDEATWAQGIRDLHAATGPNGTFCYTFFKGVGRV